MAGAKGSRPDLAERNRANATHGMTGKETFNLWANMLQRCENQNDKDYPRYGGRGITVCPEWHDFSVFFADMGSRPTGMTLDRKDNAGPYCKENCRWATAKQQARNRRNSHMIEFQGKTMCIAEWAETLGIERKTLEMRLRATTVEDALTRPYVPRGPNKVKRKVEA